MRLIYMGAFIALAAGTITGLVALPHADAPVLARASIQSPAAAPAEAPAPTKVVAAVGPQGDATAPATQSSPSIEAVQPQSVREIRTAYYRFDGADGDYTCGVYAGGGGRSYSVSMASASGAWFNHLNVSPQEWRSSGCARFVAEQTRPVSRAELNAHLAAAIAPITWDDLDSRVRALQDGASRPAGDDDDDPDA